MKKILIFSFLIIFIIIPLVIADNILIFSAHPDDETIGLGGKITQSVGKGDDIRLIIMTDGAPDEYKYDREYDKTQYSSIRKKETITAMALAGLAEENILFLDYDDSGFIFDLQAEGIVKVIDDMAKFINNFAPDEIYVHAYEHGHIDHDTTHFIVKKAFEKSNIPASMFEYIEYNSFGFGVPFPDNEDVIDNNLYPIEHLDMAKEELSLKKLMLTQYKSQNPNKSCRDKANIPNYNFSPNINRCDLGLGDWTECEEDLVCYYYTGPDMIRKLPPYDYTKSPCIDNSCTWTDNNFYDIIAEVNVLLEQDNSVNLKSKSGFFDYLRKFFIGIILKIKSFF